MSGRFWEITRPQPQAGDPCYLHENRIGSVECRFLGRPPGEWARIPVDYFANLDHSLHGAPGKK